MTVFRMALLTALLGINQVVFAENGVKQLKVFTENLISFSGDFTQVVYDANSKPVQESAGVMILQRPGKFSWNYTKPSPQLIVADGESVWIYDEELAQVTVKKLDSNMGSSPILLLGSDTPLESEFELKNLGQSDGIDWVELKPKKADTDFETVYLGLSEGSFAAMELRDKFGQATQIKFSNTTVNGDVDETLFKFSPPEGVDVIGEP